MFVCGGLVQELLNVIENLKTKLLAERRRNLVQEMEIRKEMGDAMLQQLMESEELRRCLCSCISGDFISVSEPPALWSCSFSDNVWSDQMSLACAVDRWRS